MGNYILKRALLALPTLLVVSMVTFFVIELPPGDFLTSYVAQLRASGDYLDQVQIDKLRERYGLDRPVYERYYKWMAGIARGDFGYSLEWKKPVRELIGDRVLLTLILTATTMLATWLVAIPIGVLSATKQYSFADHLTTTFGFIGLGTPGFLLALVVMFLAYRYLGSNVSGFFSPDFQNATWSWARIVDLLKHLWLPVLVLGVNGTAGLIRTMRANLLDELHKPYVETARAKGLRERRLLWKYPVRLALNPFVSSAGWMLPQLFSGATIVSVVLSLPTVGQMLLRSLQSQDMYLAGSLLLVISVLTILGTFVSDIALGLMDPRIRF